MNDKPARPQGVRCRVCDYLVTFADLHALAEVRPDVYWVSWHCGCGDREQYGRLSPIAIDALLGEHHPRLPYSAAPFRIAPLDHDSEELLADAAALLECVETVHDFLELCTQ